MYDSCPLIVGYIGDYGLKLITKQQALQNDVLNVAFGEIQNGKVIVNLKNLSYLTTIRQYNPHIRIVLSVGGWGADGFSEAASTPSSRALFASSALEVLMHYDFDGIDIDWEYPCHSESGIISTPNDKYTATLLLQELRKYLDYASWQTGKYYSLSMCTGADDYFTAATEMNQIAYYVDYIEILTFDMRGGFQVLSGHHTNLYYSLGDLSTLSCQKSTLIYEYAGVPKNKILIASAFYSRMWENLPDVNNGLFQLSTNVGYVGPSYTELVHQYISKDSYTRYWDNMAKAPYLFNGSTFLSYDDPESIAWKCQYVKSVGLRGVTYWLFEFDQTGTLLDALHRNLKC